MASAVGEIERHPISGLSRDSEYRIGRAYAPPHAWLKSSIFAANDKLSLTILGNPALRRSRLLIVRKKMQHETSNDEGAIELRCGSHAAPAACGSSDRFPALRMIGPKTPIASRFVRWVIDARAVRRRFFDSHLFADPAWDMLLELYALESEGRRISVSKLSVAAGVPCTTALRWIDKLESESLVVRSADPLDARRIWVGLSDLGLATMQSYAEQVSAMALPD